MKRIIAALEEKLGTPLSPEEKVDTLITLAWKLRNIDEKHSRRLTEEAAALAENISYWSGQAYALRNEGSYLHYAGEYDSAIRKFFEAQAIFSKTGDSIGEANALLWTGIVHATMGNTSAALGYFSNTLELSREIGDKADMSAAMTHIGRIYSMLGEHELGLKYLRESLLISGESSDSQQHATTLGAMGVVYEAMGDLESALDMQFQALTLRKSIGDVRGIGSSVFFIGRIQEQLGHYAKALRAYLRLYYGLLTPDIDSWAWAKAQLSVSIGELYVKAEKHDKALPYIEYALTAGTEIGALTIECGAHRLLARVFRKRGDFASALEHFECYHELEKKVGGEDAQRLMRTLEAERARQEAEIFRLKNDELSLLNRELSDAYEEAGILNRHLTDVNRNLELLNQEKNEFLSIAAHDLKNPLTSIALETGILLNYTSRLSAEELRKHLQKILITTRRMSGIIANFLDVNAIESGKFQMKSEQILLQDILNSIIAEHEERANAKDISLSAEFCNDAVYTLADRIALFQIFDNLVSNAIKYSPHGKQIRLRLAKDGESFCRVEVEDEGQGFSEEDKSKLFGKFARLSARPTGGESSTGLGLSIVKNLVEKMGASIECESEQGRGAKFIIALPVAISEESLRQL